MNDIPFSELLQDAMNRYKVGPKKLEEILIENGIDNINYRRISEYYYGKTTPPYEKAKFIMEILGEPVPEDQLLYSLNLGKQINKDEKELHQREMSTEVISVNIRLRNITGLDQYSYRSDLAKEAFYSRVAEKYKDPKKVSLYIEELIRKDLNSEEESK